MRIKLLTPFTILLMAIAAYTQQPQTTVTINGQKFVLVPERTFSQIEKMVDEVPALRNQNEALKAKSVNDDKIIAKDAELLLTKDKLQEATQKALNAETMRAEAEKDAKEALKKALAVSETDRARLERKVKSYRRLAVIGAIATVATWLILK